MNQLGTQVSIRLPDDIVAGIEQFRASNSTRHLTMHRSDAIRALLTLGLASVSKPVPKSKRKPKPETCPPPQAGPVPDTGGAVELVRASRIGTDGDGRAVYSCRYRGNTVLASQAVESALVGLYRYTSSGQQFSVNYRMTAEEVRALGEDIAGALGRARAGVAS